MRFDRQKINGSTHQSFVGIGKGLPSNSRFMHQTTLGEDRKNKRPFPEAQLKRAAFPPPSLLPNSLKPGLNSALLD